MRKAIAAAALFPADRAAHLFGNIFQKPHIRLPSIMQRQRFSDLRARREVNIAGARIQSCVGKTEGVSQLPIGSA